MNIGDKVRLMHGHEEGVITRFLDKDLLEIEIEDGFQIPVMRNEVVVVSQQEQRYFKREPKQEKETTAPASEDTTVSQGVYFAFVPLNDRQLALHLVNTTGFDLAYLVGEEDKQNFKGISTGVLPPQNSVKLCEVLVSAFDQWPSWVVQLLYFRQGYYTLRAPLVRKLRFKAATFFKSKRQAPLLHQPSFLFQVDEQAEGGQPLDAAKLKEQMLSNLPEQSSGLLRLERPPREVDLHIEHLVREPDKINKNEMLSLQLETFEQTLDNAIATGMDEIIFIHGVGNGILRDALHKRLSQMNNIQYFQDAKREKFGYGATLIRIK